jgi:hypothetical protein
VVIADSGKQKEGGDAEKAHAPNSRNASGYFGVYKKESRWKAQIRYGGTDHYLGTFDTKEDAAREFDKAAKANHSDSMMQLNFPPEDEDDDDVSEGERPVPMPRGVMMFLSGGDRAWWQHHHYDGVVAVIDRSSMQGKTTTKTKPRLVGSDYGAGV